MQTILHTQLLPILQKAKESYVLWYGCCQTLAKNHRYTLGQKVDNLFCDLIEAIVTACFLNRQEKLPYIRHAIKKSDTLKIFLMILWEIKSLDNKKYLELSIKLEEIGRMLGGWQGQILKQNSPDIKTGEK
ncbi:MAG: hypothetical protein A2Y82_00680 [Candidatus Buchananbacteria bacterium RBG_13_36_9]|uniref:bAvd-like domain-containing protein n=1 Tax=Candidatus Buchananbacteria bacterium RBG_13_36_9 TaxID=1797530 RepID=A0A1G1XP01_9BACT|nr:MAG: hypothetical protein A2Y82_00680 [Candidatus Buchananbacteria bacterium RBG_13_36_9]